MRTYNPKRAPDSAEWLALDEMERIDRVAAYHEQTRAQFPSLQAHAAIHAAVENQLAEGIETVQDALKRVMDEGLDRHDAIHAVGSVLAGYMWNLMRGGQPGPDVNAPYHQALKSLTAKKWLESGD